MKDKTFCVVIIWKRWKKIGKIWGKNVGKVGKICQNEKTDWKEISMEMTH
jgi:hypothetical protein